MLQGDDILKEELIELFTANEWDELFRMLADKVSSLGNARLEMDLHLMESRYNELEDRKNLGTLDPGKYQTERNKIGEGITYLIQKAYGEKIEPPDVLETERQKILEVERQGRRKRLLLYLLSAMLGLTLFLAFILSPLWTGKDKTFSNTFYIQGKYLGDCPIPTGSSLKVFLSSQPLQSTPNEHCQVVINEIAGRFRNEAIPVRVSLQAVGYELVHPDSQYVLTGAPVYLEVKRDNSLGWVHGKVWEKERKREYVGARIEIKSVQKSWVTNTDSLGNFAFYVPAESQGQAYQLIVKMGEEIWTGQFHPPNEAGIEIMATE